MDCIKLAYILTPITFGGAEKVNLNFLSKVDRSLFDIKLVLLTRPWDKEPVFIQMLKNLAFSYDTVPVSNKPGEGLLRIPRVVARFYSILKNGSFNMVHTHGYFADICGLPLARLLGIQCLSTCHGFISNDRNLVFYNRASVNALRLCGSVIAVSEEIKNDLVIKGIKASRITVIPNAVETSLDENDLRYRRYQRRRILGIDEGEFIVGYLGRLSEEKGLNQLIKAFIELLDSEFPARLMVVGDGPERPSLEKMAKDNGIENVVFFAGFQADIENWIPAFDVFVLPSLTEGTPMVLLEAMAFGVPVIATAVGGVPEIVEDGVNGFLVSPNNSSAIMEKIKLLMSEVSNKNKLINTAFHRVHNKYNIDIWCKKIENQYLNLLNRQY